jgi:uncharacterized membrane protein YhaH (DUF805 family)
VRFNASSNSSGDSFGDMLLKLIITRAAQGESEIQEHIERNAHTAATMPLAQAGAAAVGIVAVLVGLGLIGWQAAWLLDWDLTPGDFLLVGCLGIIIFFSAVAIIHRLAHDANHPTILLLAAALGGLLLIGILAALLSHRHALTWWRAMAIVAGLACLIPGLALAYRQLVDLTDPFGKTSAMERMIRPYFGQLFGQPDPEPEYSRFMPYTNANGTKAVSVGTGPLGKEDAKLLEFAQRGAGVGLSRRVWLGKTLTCTGESVTRDVYDGLVARMVRLGYAIPAPSRGKSARWAIAPTDAIAHLEAPAEMGQWDAT